MQLKLSFNMLLASVLVTLSSVHVDAAPYKRNAGMVTLPLKRHHNLARDDIHPLVLHQLHLNRGHKRHALMTGRQSPSLDELSAALQASQEASGKKASTSEGLGLEKRFNRSGVPTNKKRFNRYPHSDKLSVDHQPTGADSPSVGMGSGAGYNNPIPDQTVTLSGGPEPTQLAGAAQDIGGNAAIAAVEDQTLALANPPNITDSLGLAVELNDVGYSATVQIGTPPAAYMILMDSGSADFWVGSDNCQGQNGGRCGNHQFLGTTTSSTFNDSGNPFNVTYGTGFVSGTVVQDNVSIAGLSLNAHTFGTAQVESQQFSTDATPFDGLMGLAQSTLSNQGTPTPIEALKSTGAVQNTITSYKLSRQADNDPDGEISFGGLDDSKFDSSTLTVLPNINQQGFWEAQMGDITVNNQSANLQGRSAILDTGTTLIIAPQSDAEAIHSAIPGAKPVAGQSGTFTIPCNTNAQVALTFGSTSFVIDPRDLAFAPVAPGSQDCTSGISGVQGGTFGNATEWLVGDVFLKNAYFSHNVDTNTVSLAIPV